MYEGLNVRSEIGRLRKVMLSRPGAELLNLSPDTLAPLLFDDIPFLEEAQREHDAFARMLSEEGVEVLYLDELVAEALDAGVSEVVILNGTFPHSLLLEIFTDAGCGTMFTQD